MNSTNYKLEPNTNGQSGIATHCGCKTGIKTKSINIAMVAPKHLLAYIVSMVILVAITSFQGYLMAMQNKNTSTVKIKIGQAIFTATMYENPTAKAFTALLPITLKLTELNGNEKYATLPKNLPVDGYKPNKINDGDIMLYGSSTVVLFYKSFTTPYSYTRMGKIDDTSGIKAALGSGNVEITFEQ